MIITGAASVVSKLIFAKDLFPFLKHNDFPASSHDDDEHEEPEVFSLLNIRP